jgi:glycosyltransferase involved in cell wall biosynthesis
MFGGGQRVVLDLRKGLVAVAGLEVELWLLGECRETRGLADARIEYDGRYNHPRTVLRTVRQLRALLDQRTPDIVHSHGWDADLLAFLALRGRSTRHVIHLHVMTDWLGSRAWRHALRRRLARRMLSRAAATLAVSAAVAERWRSALALESDAIEVLPNGIDTCHYAPVAGTSEFAGQIRIGLVSRLVPGKGLENALVALAELRSSGLQVRLLVAGDGPLRQALMIQAEQLGLADAVEWLGQLSDMPDFYRRIDLYVQASLSEGMPLGLLEALACGCPVVATSVGGTAEILRDGVEGFLVPAADVNALVRAITRALKDPLALRAMGLAARRRIVEHHTLECMALGAGRIYRRVLGEARVGAPGQTVH